MYEIKCRGGSRANACFWSLFQAAINPNPTGCGLNPLAGFLHLRPKNNDEKRNELSLKCGIHGAYIL